jgi:hypothetical protein
MTTGQNFAFRFLTIRYSLLAIRFSRENDEAAGAAASRIIIAEAALSRARTSSASRAGRRPNAGPADSADPSGRRTRLCG